MLVTAACLLALLHAIRLNVGLRWMKTAAVALGVFVACQVVAAIALQRADIRREMHIDRVLYTLPEDAQILIVGSSHTARGLDADALQAELHVPVAQLSYLGSFAFEQDLALERYLARARPSLILIEIATEFSTHTVAAPYAPRDIEEADVVRTWWGGRLLMDRPDRTLRQRLETVWDRVRSMLAKLTHAGIVRHAKHAPLWPIKGFIPDDWREAGVTDEAIAAALSADRGPDIDAANARAFRLWQKEKLRAMGVKDVRFFVPPIADPIRRGWSNSVCASLERDCIPMEAEFVRSLPPRMWMDKAHLRPEGAHLFTHWFAEKVRAVQ